MITLIVQLLALVRRGARRRTGAWSYGQKRTLSRDEVLVVFGTFIHISQACAGLGSFVVNKLFAENVAGTVPHAFINSVLLCNFDIKSIIGTTLGTHTKTVNTGVVEQSAINWRWRRRRMTIWDTHAFGD